MHAAQTIRDAVQRVQALRAQAAGVPDLAQAARTIKRIQSRRFARTYADALASAEYGGATRFFLQELYGEADYASRDAQFARIARALETLFPQAVVQTAVQLAQLHVLTEELDHHMALAWLELARTEGAVPDVPDAPVPTNAEHKQAQHHAQAQAQRYLQAWSRVGRQQDRQLQLRSVLAVGVELDVLTRTPGLRLMLKMMRGPARAAGMEALQHFLESGFDTFARMSGKGQHARAFLATIDARESAWIEDSYDPGATRCVTELRDALCAKPPH